MKKWLLLAFMMILLVGCSSTENGGADQSEATELDMVINVAITPQPNTLDQHATTTTIASVLGRHIYEQLVTFNSSYEVIPTLAESIEESDDGERYVYHLRRDVKFHNGKELKAEDVVASLEKWHAVSTKAQALIPNATFTEVDEHAVELVLDEPVYGVLTLFADASQSAIIMPKEIAETAEASGAKEYIGTGPFRFVEWKQDQYVHLEKFEDYQPLDQVADGLSGKKEALVDDLYFHFVTDSSTRLTGLQSGEYDVVSGLAYDSYDMIENDPTLETVTDLLGPIGLVYNKKQGIFSDVKMRQAMNTALDLESIMLVAFSNENFYRLDPGHMILEQKDWYSEAGKDRYNINDPEKAKRLFEEAGYKGEEIKIITTKDYEYMYHPAVVIQEQLQKIGVNVKLEVADWATVLELRADPTAGDAFITAFPKVATPQQLLYVGAEYPGWTNDEEMTDLLETIDSAKNQEEAQATFAELQDRMYDYLPITKFGDYYTLGGQSVKVDGMQMQDSFILWNTTKSK